MGITLKQIAEMAGVHKSTVDKVIHNRPGVSDAKRQQIRQLLDEYGYESNPLAKALNYQKKKMAIAVVLPVVDALADLKRGMELVRQDFNSFNFEIQYYEIPDADAQAKCLRQLCGQKISGVVVGPIEAPAVAEALRALDAAQIPVVTVNSDLADVPRLCSVRQDEAQSAQVAARLAGLLLGGKGKLGIISSHAMRGVVQRRQVFENYLPQCWQEVQIAGVEEIQETAEAAYGGASALLGRCPDIDALFITCGCVPDICRAVQDKGLSGRLAVICYEKYPAIKELVRNGQVACTISGNLMTQGRLAMRLLFEYIIYDRKPEHTNIFVRHEILFRENI